ncbi:MAG: His/Gly/Thr/Pro-type tRNA ligase C-terminal domain-containing protein, partial [Tepidiformaceae bacterium]
SNRVRSMSRTILLRPVILVTASLRPPSSADLLGIPWRVTVSPRALERGGVELRNRLSGETEVVGPADVFARIR